MTKFFKPGIGLLRLIAFIEGLSFILLVFIAMPIKYIGNNPEPVRQVGMAHGVLFVLFVLYTIVVSLQLKWKVSITFQVLLSSIVPFGTFYIDKKILSKQ